MVAKASANRMPNADFEARGVSLIGCTFVAVFACTVIAAVGAALADSDDVRLKCIVIASLAGTASIIAGVAYCCARKALRKTASGQPLLT